MEESHREMETTESGYGYRDTTPRAESWAASQEAQGAIDACVCL